MAYCRTAMIFFADFDFNTIAAVLCSNSGGISVPGSMTFSFTSR